MSVRCCRTTVLVWCIVYVPSAYIVTARMLPVMLPVQQQRRMALCAAAVTRPIQPRAAAAAGLAAAAVDAALAEPNSLHAPHFVDALLGAFSLAAYGDSRHCQHSSTVVLLLAPPSH